MSTPPAQQPALSLTSLPAAVSERILRQLPLADRVRAGGVSPAWRPVAHAPALYGPELKLSDALDAPRTVADASSQHRAAEKLRCSSLAVLRSLAALAAGTLTALDVTHSDFSIPDAVWSEEIVAICAANPALTRVTADAPSTLPGALQLLRRCPRVRTLLLPRLRTASRSHGITAETIAALTPEERMLSARLALDTLDLGRKMCEGPSLNDYLPPLPNYLGALTSVEVRASLAALCETVAAVGAGAWAVGELHLPGCKNEDALLVELLAALTMHSGAAAAAPEAQQAGACRVHTLVLHYSFKEGRWTPMPMSADAARALAATLDALPSLRELRFQDERDPELIAAERESDYTDDAPLLSSYLFSGESDEAAAAYDALRAAILRHSIRHIILNARSFDNY